jgi:methionyl-tRNA synthetase
MLMGQNLPYKLPDEVPANEFYMLEGRQFSKSDGWTIDLDEFFSKYTADQIRYAIAANAPETSDSEFTWKDFQMRCNSELLGKFGNFVHRVLVFAKQQCGGKVPPKSTLLPIDHDFVQQMETLVESAATCYEEFRLRKASQTLMELAHLGNAYFDAKKPWSLAKDENLRDQLNTTVALCIDCIQKLSLVASPIIPEAAQKIWEMIGHRSQLAKGSWKKIAETPIATGVELTDPIPLFRKIEDSEVEIQIEKLEHLKKMNQESVISAPTTFEPLKETIAFETFDKVDIRVVRVLEAEKVPKSKKLLKLKVDLGFETRTIVSGISQHYEPEQLIGKNVLLLANLAPATLMGIESQGMILAASVGTQLELPMLQNIVAGAQVS